MIMRISSRSHNVTSLTPARVQIEFMVEFKIQDGALALLPRIKVTIKIRINIRRRPRRQESLGEG